MANRPTIRPCRRTQSPVTRDSNVATIRPHAVNKTKYGTNRPVMTHAAAKVLKNIARNLRRSLSAALPMELSPRRSHRRIYIQGTWSLLRLRDTPLPGPKSYRIGSNECFDSAKCRGRYCNMKSWPMPLWVMSDKAQAEHNESAYPPIADMKADIDFCRLRANIAPRMAFPPFDCDASSGEQTFFNRICH